MTTDKFSDIFIFKVEASTFSYIKSSQRMATFFYSMINVRSTEFCIGFVFHRIKKKFNRNRILNIYVVAVCVSVFFFNFSLGEIAHNDMCSYDFIFVPFWNQFQQMNCKFFLTKSNFLCIFLSDLFALYLFVTVVYIYVCFFIIFFQDFSFHID